MKIISDVLPVEGPSPPITNDMVRKAVCKMIPEKAAGPSGVVSEMIKASGGAGIELIRDLINAIIAQNCIPSNWQYSYIVNLYKGKGDALVRGYYRGLKLMDHLKKTVESVVKALIRRNINIDEMRSGFMPGRCTTDAIFILCQLQEKYMAVNKQLFLAFVDLEKAFDRVPRKIIWWAMRKLGVEEWLARMVQVMYVGVKSIVKVGDGCSKEFGVDVGVHQGSVLSPLLFIIVIEAVSMGFRIGSPWKLLYADDLIIISEALECLVSRLEKWLRD